jgi:signal transduction histidine kinase
VIFLADDPTPHAQPLAALPLIASLINGELADGQEHHAALLATRDRPHVLDDATVECSITLHTEQRGFLGVFAEQLERWRNERLTDAQRRELDRLKGQLDRLRAVLEDILKLAAELKQGTIERVLAKSDLELGIEALMQMTKGR